MACLATRLLVAGILVTLARAATPNEKSPNFILFTKRYGTVSPAPFVINGTGIRAAQEEPDLMTSTNLTFVTSGESRHSERTQRQKPQFAKSEAFLDEGTTTQFTQGAPYPWPENLTVPRPAAPVTFFNVSFPPASDELLVFDGIENLDQQSAGTGVYANTNRALEPPDGGLCVGNGFVVQVVNSALAIFDSGSGEALVVPVALNQFFQMAPFRIPAPAVGAFLSDPRCVFDRDTGRFFVSILFASRDAAAGAFAAPTATLLAVSASGDPRAAFALFRLFTTNDGTNGTPDFRPVCPCLLDMPRVAVNGDALIIVGDSFVIANGSFFSTDVYAMDKFKLAAGDLAVLTAAYINSTATRVQGNSVALNVARVSPDEAFPSDARGVVYFAAALDIKCDGTPVRQLALFALVGTRALRALIPFVGGVQLVQSVIDSLIEYNNCQLGLSRTGGLPVTQRPGPRLLNTSAPLELLDSNGDSVREPVFANRSLFVALNTIVPGTATRPPTVGIAYFVITPSVTTAAERRKKKRHATSPDVTRRQPATVTGQVVTAGVIAAPNGNNVVFPAFAIGRNGRGVVGVTLSGPDFFPSVAYVHFDGSHGPSGDIILARPGAAPEDGVTGYVALARGFPQPVSRWGDYFMGTADEQSNLWFGVEYIPDRPRSRLANWGTGIVRVSALNGTE
ncbi:hypothetical protein KFL_006600030 [Klebsormidium nitens]|uniref:Uncharacterized protein n=1 Tax=Klebsormidium nitens TaxID=105231 RepID=A0A1Y1IR33_KLENI|nr:hypothetical protein KFL_006600030 [Klebsormidium nitens]|eukprot:GAQ90598.1 hypothetical protein KFL_006600030 [Klebsormidium nitens]